MKPEELKMLMAKKKMKPMSDNEKEAKMSVMKNLSNDMAEMMKHKLGGLKKVEVSADSKEGIEKGLEKAQAMIGDHHSELENGEGEESPEHSMSMGDEDESEDESEEECEPQTEEEIDAEIEELMKKKAELKK